MNLFLMLVSMFVLSLKKINEKIKIEYIMDVKMMDNYSEHSSVPDNLIIVETPFFGKYHYSR
jgi:hypothetical protein